MKKNIAILGSTGSIGVNSLNVIRHLASLTQEGSTQETPIQVNALAAKSNIALLEEQAKEFNPKLIAVFDEDKALLLQKRLPNTTVLSGIEGLKAVASFSGVDLVISAMSGTIGLVPTEVAIKAGKDIGLANKEVLVSGGQWLLSLVKKNDVQLLPIDSEHSAIFQCLNGEKAKTLKHIILTASGGSFLNHSAKQLESVTVDDALNHPNWKMGSKITVDSSTLMNKGLEVIEASLLFNVPTSKIKVVIHPQSIIHSMVEFVDGSIMAQMGDPDMKTPIQYAITYPDRAPGIMKSFDFTKNLTLQFSPPDYDKFRSLKLAYEAMEVGDSLPCYMNAVNDTLVHRFLSKKIRWKDIMEKLETLMLKHPIEKIHSLEDIQSIDQQAREEAALV